MGLACPHRMAAPETAQRFNAIEDVGARGGTSRIGRSVQRLRPAPDRRRR
jgi:hypothetical protein